MLPTQREEVARCATCGAPRPGRERYCRACGHRQPDGAGGAQPDTAGGAPEGTSTRPPDQSVLLPTRAPATRGIAVTAVVLGAVFALGMSTLGARFAFFGPEDTVHSYFDALAGRDADAAWSMLEHSAGSRGELLEQSTLESSGYQPPAEVVVDGVARDGERAVATVAFEVDGVAHRLDMTLTEGRGPLRRWTIENGLFSIELAEGVTADGLSLAGVPVSESGRMVAFPGGYQVTAADHPLFALGSALAIPGGDPVSVSFSLHGGGERAIEEQVRSYLDGCVSQPTLDPDGCAFESGRAFYDYDSEYRDITWTMIDYPELGYTVQEDHTVYVEGTGGLARLTATADSSFVDDIDENVEVVVDGWAWAEGGAVRFEPDG